MRSRLAEIASGLGAETLPLVDLPAHDGGPVECQVPARQFNGLAVVGEAPGSEEVRRGVPFLGAGGHRLDAALAKAGVDRSSCLVANVFRHRPADGRVVTFFPSDDLVRAHGIQVNRRLPRYMEGRIAVPYDEDVRILWRVLRSWRPRVVLALGNTALWALSFKHGGITRLAGTIQPDRVVPGTPVLATYHPDYVGRNVARNSALGSSFEAHVRMAARMLEGHL